MFIECAETSIQWNQEIILHLPLPQKKKSFFWTKLSEEKIYNQFLLTASEDENKRP